MSLFNILKSLLLILILLYIAPPMIDSIKQSYNRYFTAKTLVAVIPITQGLSVSYEYTKQLHTYFKDDAIKALLLTIDCAGGPTGTCQILYNEISTLKKEYPKPIVALIENNCTAGAYYIACASDHIIAPGTALIGGIGTNLPYHVQEKESNELLQTILNDAYKQFATDVAHQRNLAMNNLAVWADGKLFSGNQAQQIGLIDEIGSTSNAINAIKEKALIEGEIEMIRG